jgi:hypothetical protein
VGKDNLFMSTLEQEILQRIRKLDAEKQQRVLDFVEQLENERPLTLQELRKLPPKERQAYVKAAIESSAHEDFETFEAYSEEPIDE